MRENDRTRERRRDFREDKESAIEVERGESANK